MFPIQNSYPIHSSRGGKLVGFATKGEARRRNSTSRSYRCAIWRILLNPCVMGRFWNTVLSNGVVMGYQSV